MSGLAAKSVTRESLPLIDISGLQSHDARSRTAVAEALRAACLDRGFFYVSGHGVALDLIGNVFAAAERFFGLPEEAKLRLHKKNSRANRGYEPIGGQRLEDGTPPDLKESFFIGTEQAADDPRVIAGEFGRGPNQWPDFGPETDGFQDAVRAYMDAMEQLGGRLYRGLALSLGLPETYFDGFYRDPMNILRMIHYPQQPANPLPDQKGCGAHTDFGGITLLAQDDIGGLQVWDDALGWIHAAPIPGTFVVNLGDFMARWSNDLYRSTLHRVVNVSGKERYSLPYFCNGAPNYNVSCIPTCVAAGDTPKYGPTSVAQHFLAMYRKTYIE